MVIAALEADLTSERTTAAIEYRRNQGIHVGNAPFGMERDENSALIPSPDAEVVREVLAIYAGEGRGFQATADYANAAPRLG